MTCQSSPAHSPVNGLCPDKVLLKGRGNALDGKGDVLYYQKARAYNILGNTSVYLE